MGDMDVTNYPLPPMGSVHRCVKCGANKRRQSAKHRDLYYNDWDREWNEEDDTLIAICYGCGFGWAEQTCDG